MGEAVLDKMDFAADIEGQAYNPLEFIEGEDDEDWMDDDGLLLPEALPPERTAPKKLASVYSPERAGSVRQAVHDLVTVNASRRHALLSILDWARDGVRASDLFCKIEELQADNRSVYAPVSYCRMLERAGALRLELEESGARPQEGHASCEGGAPGCADTAGADAVMPGVAAGMAFKPAEAEGDAAGAAAGIAAAAVPESSAAAGAPDACDAISPLSDASAAVSPEDAGACGIEYLSIEEEVDPVWRATEEGLAAYEELIQGSEWREKVFGPDAVYAEVYLAVMRLLAQGGQAKAPIAELAETFEVTRQPLKRGAYFIDVLEATSAIQWVGGAWNLTDLGKKLLVDLEEFCEKRREAPAGQEG